MELNADKLREAEEYMLTYAPHTQEFDAAMQHVQWVAEHGYRTLAEHVFRKVLEIRGNESNVVKKLTR